MKTTTFALDKRVGLSGGMILEDLTAELALEDQQQYPNFTRMAAMEIVLLTIVSKIARKDTVMRKSIAVRGRLLVTIRFLATGMFLERNFHSSAECALIRNFLAD